MLEIKGASQDEMNVIKEFLTKNALNIDCIENYIGNCMVAYDKDILVGVAGYIREKDMAIIKFAVVSKNRRKEYLGDGIVKALLNLADRNGIRRVFVNGDEETLFFRKIGFKEVSLQEARTYCKDIDMPQWFIKNKTLQVVLPDYFLKACKSNK
ncbi:GNAT family N-acetyltransferase [Marinisporobacter balticus]|uniref:Amino-acid N-acetyltransferase n=1 Tax=Marinisporobacter balticus TaxID=2018667 RepID=A0A4V2SCL8_9FIRM|nr:GNAT family N-acetyltransferase [Marinisporobacter balticus]TCO79800.1 amino-acid N-acetyltransferase [Marinisporobacter balticus]